MNKYVVNIYYGYNSRLVRSSLENENINSENEKYWQSFFFSL